jgi:formylglycine-generating enzyme required for sulfatase activity
METYGVKDDVKLSRDRDRAKRRVEVFLARYSDAKTRDAALEYAGYAAFPLTLTTDLAYHLRERFTPKLEWYFASDVLLSGLCDSVGYDLYEMTAATRSVLLTRLMERWDEQGHDRTEKIDELAAFVGEYILYRLSVEEGDRAKQLGDPTQWLALACLRSESEVTEQIKQDLLRLLEQTDDPRERFRLSDMAMGVVDMLGQSGLEAIELRELVEKLENDEPIDRISQIRRIMEDEGFPPLISKEVEYKTIVFEDISAIEELHSIVGEASLENRISQIRQIMKFEGFPPLISKEVKYKRIVFEDVELVEELVAVKIETEGRLDRYGKKIDQQIHTVSIFIEQLVEGVELEMVAIPSGKFIMGSPKTEKESTDNERPQHEVTVQPFFMSATLVTQAQWQVVAGFSQILRPIQSNPSYSKGDDLPVDRVSWEDAEEFCLRLSAYVGREWNYQLPTEAQWEYACRAGTITPFHFGETIVERVCNYDSREVYQDEPKGEYLEGTTPVKKYRPNAFGLYDCHGNVLEWCQDDWHDSYEGAPETDRPWVDNNTKKEPFKVQRGGSWSSYPWDCRSASRDDSSRTTRSLELGFRVVSSVSRILPHSPVTNMLENKSMRSPLISEITVNI